MEHGSPGVLEEVALESTGKKGRKALPPRDKANVRMQLSQLWTRIMRFTPMDPGNPDSDEEALSQFSMENDRE